jgi:exodeoxyribonuclease VII large subunit
MRASARRRLADHRRLAKTHMVVLERKAGGARVDRERRMAELQGRARRFAGTRTEGVARRSEDLERLVLALGAHDPARTLARGYALIEDPSGEPVTTAQGAQAARELGLRFHDGRVRARVHEPGEEPPS